jgi:hypothetical protein
MSLVGEGRAISVRILLGAVLALLLAVSPATLGATTPVKPRVSTGGVKHVRGTSGQLDAVVDPNGVETTCYFQYGPTTAYGSQTKPMSVGAGLKGVKVGIPVTGLLPGYNYRVVATNVQGVTATGGNKVFTGGKSNRLKIVIPKDKEDEQTVNYGGTAEVSGGLTGLGNAYHGLALQGSPFPYTASFVPLGGLILSSSTGSFVFKVAKLTQNTEFRVLTVDTRPLYSSVITVRVAPLIRLHVHALGGGRYRFYGTVSPGKLTGIVDLQKLEPQKASSKRSGPKPHSVGGATLKKGTATSARFSVVLSGLTGTFHYRAYIKLPKGALVSGHSNNVLIHGPRASAKSTKKKKNAKRKTKKSKKK